MALNLLAPSDPFGLVQAPAFIWFVAGILLVGTLALLARLWCLVHRKRCLYRGLTRDLRALKSEYNPVLRDGLPQAAHDTMGQLFDKTTLESVWNGFASQLVVKHDTTGADRFWTSESAATVFNEASVLDSRLNRNFYTAFPGMVTGIGLLCTFVAILIALLGVRLDANTHQFTGLDKMISGLSGKFLSSIAALLAATIFLFVRNCFFTVSREAFTTW